MRQDHGQSGLMPGSARLGRVAGVPIGLHYSWLLIAGLISVSLATHFEATHPDWQPALVWSASLVTALLFFVSLLAHELSHALVARMRGLPVRSITLFALGGVAQIEKDATSAKTEFLVAVVGPITSIGIGLLCLSAATFFGWTPQSDASGVAGSVLGWLGSINVLLALFNLIPGYPLDGGRLLRAGLWAAYGDPDRATRTAARAGQLVAGLFIVAGLVQFFSGAGLGGLWLAFIGWFLLMAAQASYQQVAVGEMLRDVRVADVMVNDCATAGPGANLQSLVEDVLLRTGRRCVVVKGGERVLGLLTLRDVRSVERARWHEVTASEVMRPLDAVKTVTPDAPISEALGVMAREDINQLPVIANGQLEGVVSRSQILQLLQARAELRAA